MGSLFVSIFCLCAFVSSGFSEIQLSFAIGDGRAFFDERLNTCDYPVNSSNLCDAYVIIKINGDEVYRTKEKNDTDHPIFDEKFRTKSISENSTIVFEMWDKDDDGDVLMSTWTGNKEYYLNRDLLVGKKGWHTPGTQRNFLSVSTELFEAVQLLILIKEASALVNEDGKTCDSPVDGKPNPCDPYVIVKIDGQQVYRTKDHDNTGGTGFWEEFETGLINEDSILAFEMWDSDVGDQSTDDHMWTWSGTRGSFFGAPYIESHIADSFDQNSLRVNIQKISPKKPEEIQLSFTIKNGEAWFDADANACDSPVDGKPNPCDSYVVIKINGEQVYRSEQQNDTDHPTFNETFETVPIDQYSIITVEMWDSDDDGDDPMSTWSGYAIYYLSRDLFVGNETDANGSHRNSLSISTKKVALKKTEVVPEFIQLFFVIADGWTSIKDFWPCEGKCDPYISLKIDGKEVYQTKFYQDTAHPVFNEIFETGWINANSTIEFEMIDKDVGGHYLGSQTLQTWSGNADYFLNQQLFSGDRYPGTKHANSLVISTTLLDRRHPQNIQLVFNLTDGQAWLNAEGSVCDSPKDYGPNACDSSVVVKIDGKMIHNSKQVEDTDNPTFNEVFQTDWIRPDAVIEFEMWDRDYPMMHDGDENHSEFPMSAWSGNAEYYLKRDLLVGNVTDGTHRNSLSVSTKMVKLEEDGESSNDPQLQSAEEKEQKDV